MGVITRGRVGVPAWILMLAMTITVIHVVSAKLNPIGGTKANGWRENYNYTEWTLDKKFYVGDWLYFGYNKHFYSVFRVNKTSYENCNAHNPIKNMTTGAGREVFLLNEMTTYYFISDGGYCWHGMKVAIRAEALPPPVQPPSQELHATKNGSPSNLSMIFNIILPVGLVIFMAGSFFIS